MAQRLTEAELEPVVTGQPDLVADTLRVIYSDQPGRVDLEALRALADMQGLPLAGLLALTLNSHDTAGKFLAYLRAQGVNLLAPLGPEEFDSEFGDVVIGQVVEDDFDAPGMADFSIRSLAFRCRIRVDGVTMGSGAFVSPRLVLTAAHVIEKVTIAVGAGGALPKLEVLASDGLTYPARAAFFLPNHPDEVLGKLPPAGTADSHADVALLRIDRPLGRMYGQIDLPEPPVAWQGAARFVLVHFPEGAAKGISIGKIRSDGPGDLRRAHNVNAAQGSSGGPGFDRQFRFLGLHQGRFGNFRRIVPFERFAANAGFRGELNSDVPPRYLWSLDESLDSHLIIGRAPYFDALTALVEGDVAMLRGVWIRRANTNSTVGLSFSYRILEAFLRAHQKPNRLTLVPTGMGDDDLIAMIHGKVFDQGSAGAANGVQADETTQVAHDDDRARALADQLQAEAERTGETLWFYLENPPSGLLQDTQIQLEHIVAEFVARPGLRLVLSGFETYELLPQLFEDVAQARGGTQPSLVVEYLRGFRDSDVEDAVKEMARALGLKWSRDVVADKVKLALIGVTTIEGGLYDPAQLKQVSEALRAEARKYLV